MTDLLMLILSAGLIFILVGQLVFFSVPVANAYFAVQTFDTEGSKRYSGGNASAQGENRKNSVPQIKDQFIVILNDNSVDTPSSVASIAKAKGAEVLHVYEYAVKGFAIRVPNDRVLSNIQKLQDIRYIERDQVVNTQLICMYLRGVGKRPTVPKKPTLGKCRESVHSCITFFK